MSYVAAWLRAGVCVSIAADATIERAPLRSVRGHDLVPYTQSSCAGDGAEGLA